jgi:hypothetical protein
VKCFHLQFLFVRSRDIGQLQRNILRVVWKKLWRRIVICRFKKSLVISMAAHHDKHVSHARAMSERAVSALRNGDRSVAIELSAAIISRFGCFPDSPQLAQLVAAAHSRLLELGTPPPPPPPPLSRSGPGANVARTLPTVHFTCPGWN